MGATNFDNLAVGRYKNASDAYNDLVEDAVLKRLKENRGYKGKKNIKAFYFFGLASC